ncbi:hypothetical protein LMH73_009515 [Vibrio splendidus]
MDEEVQHLATMILTMMSKAALSFQQAHLVVRNEFAVIDYAKIKTERPQIELARLKEEIETAENACINYFRG